MIGKFWVRTLVAGSICLVILAGMVISHAWPLWTGRTIVLNASALGRGEQHAGGEYLRLANAATSLALDPVPAGTGATYVRTVGPGWESVRPGPGGWRQVRGRVVFIQLEPGDAGVYAPVSVSFSPVAGATNLRGRITGWGPVRPAATVRWIPVDCGLDAFYLPEGRAEAAAANLKDTGSIQMEVALASSGQARIKRLLVNGRPLS